MAKLFNDCKRNDHSGCLGKYQYAPQWGGWQTCECTCGHPRLTAADPRATEGEGAK